MSSRMSLLCLATLTFFSSACSRSDDKGDSSPAPVTVVSLNVTPVSSMVDVGEVIVLTCTANYSNGTSQSVFATWSTPDASLVSLGVVSGQSTVVTGLASGTATIEAAFSGWIAQATVVVENCATEDPGPVYAGTNPVTEYPPSGGGVPSQIWTLGAGVDGLLLNRANSALYATVDSDLFRFEISSGNSSTAATLPVDSNIWSGLDYDSLDRLWTVGYGGGDIIRIDPVSGLVSTVFSGGMTGMSDISLGADDAPYLNPLLTNSGNPWVWRHDEVAGVTSMWTLAPPGVNGPNGIGLLVPSGTAFGPSGELFIVEQVDDQIFRNDDVNLDGDALDAGETQPWANLPWNLMDAQVRNLTTTRCGVLINVLDVNSTAYNGIWWIRDINGDGDALDAGEVEMYNPNAAAINLPGSLIQAPRE